MKTTLTTCVAVIIICFGPSESYSQFHNDYFFPAKGEKTVMIATGVPYAGLGEISWGVSDRFSIGIIGGLTPTAPGIGLRFRNILHEEGTSRIFFKAPIIYYPSIEDMGNESWMLAWPALTYEFKTEGNYRFSAGAGVVGAFCIKALTHKFTGEVHHEDEMGFEGGYWETVSVGTTMQLTDGVNLHSETALVLDGAAIAGESWLSGPPVIFILGASFDL